MGMIWRSAMPLLSTLAALVIIVNSAEDNLDPEYRYNLRPRHLDTRTTGYEQPWRLDEGESVMHHTTQKDWDPESHEDPPKRRRKRKRRPIDSTDDVTSDKRYPNPDAPRPTFRDTDYVNYDTTETTRRRRKRINGRPNRWADDDDTFDPERPLRRRLHRRKLPSTTDSRPLTREFSEFAGGLKEAGSRSKFADLQVDENKYENQEYLVNNKSQYIVENTEMNPNNVLDKVTDNLNRDDITRGRHRTPSPSLLEDRSLSEFSFELGRKRNDEFDDREKAPKKEKHILDFDNDENKIKKDKFKLLTTLHTQNNQPIDPMTLKDILKRSNGTSLSEILQQHNLSLADLLHGKRNVISILQTGDYLETDERALSPDSTINRSDEIVINIREDIETHETKTPNNNNDELEKEVSTEDPPTTNSDENLNQDDMEVKFEMKSPSKERLNNLENDHIRPNKVTLRRRFPAGVRKLRMRPVVNGTYKGQLSRDMMTLNAKRYHHRRNMTKTQDWKSLMPTMLNMNTSKEIQKEKVVTESVSQTTTTSEDPTTIITEYDKPETVADNVSDESGPTVKDNLDDIEISVTQAEFIPTTTTSTTETIVTTEQQIVTEKPVVTPIIRQLNSSSIRRQAYNNRLKKKRLKQKNSTTESPQDDIMMKNLFNLGNLVSSSEFIDKTTVKKGIDPEDTKDFTGLEDFMTTAIPKKTESSTKYKMSTSPRISTTPKSSVTWVTTEETAKFEIEEILNDTRTSAELSKILMERNMTLNELVEHRERGSSHVHLADIFHNASREPNPPEPFLSKSSIEPISKETYPLRALLDANLHDPSARTTNNDPSVTDSNYVNIPVVMDFGNNVNENAENMGIMSLFNNFTNSPTTVQKTLQKDSDGTPYESTIIHVNTSGHNDINRESRVLNGDQDMVSWNEIFAMIRKNHNNTEEVVEESYKKEITPSDIYRKITLEEDVDGDGLIVLEDLQHLRDFDSNIASSSDEKLEVNSYERAEDVPKPGILNKMSGSTKSVTVATASIVGLALILFLLTYAAFKWIQQRKKDKKRTFDEKIPTPVFENRKGHKHNSSSRSISPMISSNIYTMNTLESHRGTDSPEYMWDTLRKPFQ